MYYQPIIISILVCILLMLPVRAFTGDDCTTIYGKSPHILKVAAGSPGELGLLKALADVFNKNHDMAVCWIKAGSGESLKLLKERKVDVVMVHAPLAEKQAVKEGWAAGRTLIGSNEFYIVGPANDPAKIASAKSAAEAYTRIAKAKAIFFSRGDNSGTHKKEESIWQSTGITPSGDWYVVTHDFMTATLKKADDLKGYFMTDSSTWVAEKKNLSNLKILFKGDSVLVNTYHALCRPDDASGNRAVSEQFIEFIASEQGQMIIKNFGKELYGDALYNDAVYAEKYVH